VYAFRCKFGMRRLNQSNHYIRNNTVYFKNSYTIAENMCSIKRCIFFLFFSKFRFVNFLIEFRAVEQTVHHHFVA